MKARQAVSLIAILFLGPILSPAQDDLQSSSLQTSQTSSLSIRGHSGQAPVVQVNGKSYVDIEALARIANGSLSFHGNQVVLAISPPSEVANSAPVPDTEKDKNRLTLDFLKAGIEFMSVVREWRITLVDAVQNGQPVPDQLLASLGRSASNALILVQATAKTDGDRQGLTLLQNEFTNMQNLSDSYVAKRQAVQYIPTNALDSDPLNQQVLDCARGLAAAVAKGTYEDVPSCH